MRKTRSTVRMLTCCSRPCLNTSQRVRHFIGFASVALRMLRCGNSCAIAYYMKALSVEFKMGAMADKKAANRKFVRFVRPDIDCCSWPSIAEASN